MYEKKFEKKIKNQELSTTLKELKIIDKFFLNLNKIIISYEHNT